MKILYLTDGFPLPDMPGGARYFQVAKWLQSQGYEVTVLCNARNYVTDDAVFQGTTLHDGIKIVGLSTPRGRHKSRWHRIALYVALMLQAYRRGRVLDRPDVLLAGTPPLLMPLSALLLARKFGARSILEVRDLHPQMSVASGIVHQPWIIWPWRAFEQGLRRQFDHIVAAVPRMREMIAAEGIDPARITVITSGYDLESDKEVTLSPPLAAYFERNRDKFVVGYTGNMGMGAWNIRGMVEVADHLRRRADIAFLFVGNGEQRSVCEAYAREKGLTSCTFFPPVGRLEIANVMRHCQALMMAYRDNPFYEYIIPIKLFDYMGSGRPILFSGCGDGPDLLEKARGGSVMRKFDVTRFADAIADLVDNPARALELGANNRRYVEKHLLREREFAKWRSVVQPGSEVQLHRLPPPPPYSHQTV